MKQPFTYHNSHVSPCEEYQTGIIEVRHLLLEGDAWWTEEGYL